jgi:ubiquinone biosynthesis protein
VYDDVSSARVLTTEFVTGVAMNDFIRVAAIDPTAAGRWLEANDIEAGSLARMLSLSLLRQILEDNLFHGDLHPGNIVLLRAGNVALIDFGSVGSTEREYLEKFRSMTLALATRDFVKVAELTLLMCGGLPRIDVQAVVDELVRAVQSWTARTFVRDLPFHQKSLNNIYGEVTRILVRHRCTLGWAFLRIRRAQETLDASLLVLAPDANPTEMSEEYFAQARRRMARRAGADARRRIARSAVAIRSIADDVAEIAILQLDLVRRRAQVLSSYSGNVTRALTLVTGTLAVLGILTLVLIMASWMMPTEGPRALTLDLQARLALFAAAATFTTSTSRLWRRLRAPSSTAGGGSWD